MSLVSDGLARLRALFFRQRTERELDEELQFHLEREVEERIRRGEAPEAARRGALVAFGGVELHKEQVRDARGVRPLEEVVSDIRFALRALRRNPGFTAAAVLVLAFGIGATTAVFNVVDSVLIADLPYPHPDRLIRIYERNGASNLWSLSVVDVQAIQSQQRSFDAFGAVRWGAAALSGAGSPEQIPVARVTSGFFQALGVAPAAGRLIQESDEPPDAPAVVVVSHTLAEQQLGGAAGAVGRSITLDGVSHTVVGVLPAGSDQLAGIRATAWPALQLTPPTRRGPFGLRGIGRLKNGVSLEAAGEDLAGISQRIFPLWASGFQDQTARLTPVPLRDTIVGSANHQLELFAGAVALVLLIAIANVATLMLVRASAREHELAVRTALGATRLRLARLVVTECLVVTLLAGLAGLGVAALGLRLVHVLAPNLPRISEIGLDARAVSFAVLASILSGVLAGISPALTLLAKGRTPALGADARRAGTNRRSTALRGALVVAEFALALPLLLGAGLLLNSLLHLQRVDPGYNPAGAFSVSLSLPPARYPDIASTQKFWRQTEALATEVPGIAAVGLTSSLPPDNQGDVNNFNLLDHPVPSGTAEPVAPWPAVTAGYFTAMGIPLLDGRLFSVGDSGTAPPVAVVSRAWAAHYLPGEQALGRQLISGGCTSCPPTTIIGVVGDVKYSGLTEAGEAVYEPITQSGMQQFNLVVRSRGAPADVVSRLRAALGTLDPELPLTVTTLTAQLEASLADPRRWTAVLAAFAATAALLAAFGIFGLMSYAVRQRRREIGVRMALGAQPGAVIWMVIGRGLRYALTGIGIGLGVALIEVRWVEALLFEVSPLDPATLVAGAVLLLLAASIACWLPGRRASRISPLEAIASE